MSKSSLNFCLSFSSLLAFLTLLLSAQPIFAQVDPQIQWKIMRLPHFDLIYDAKHQLLANHYADRLEDNLTFLSEYFEFFPERTVVVINDRTDLTNGYATPIPYRTIMLYPVLPGPQETISEFGDWARELTMHEYTHILSFEPRRGLVKGLYYTFGNVITPNILLPRWWLEGVAVDIETRTSEKGRLRSTFQDGSLRAYVTEDQLKAVTLPQINETSIPIWPQGGRPYLFGSLMWSEMIAKQGQDIIRKLHYSYGGRVPYFMEGPISEYTGQSYTHLFEEMKLDLEKRVQAQMVILEKNPSSQGPSIKVKNGVENFFPVISPDGLKMAFLSKDDANKRSVRILLRPSTKVPFDGSQELAEIKQRFGESLQELNPNPRQWLNSTPLKGINEREGQDSPPGGTIQRLAWFPDSKKFVFDKLDIINRFHDSSDLYVFDLTEMKVERLTRNERAREGSVSLDSKNIVFVKLDAGRTHLALYQLSDKKVRVLYSPPLDTRISTPVYISDDEILFSERAQGHETLKKYSLKSGQVQNVLSQFPDIRFPLLTAQGLIFSSSLNGVANIYLASKDLAEARPLTHSPTYVSSSAVDEYRQDIYYSELTTNGFQIKYFPMAKSKELPTALPQIQPLFADRYPPQKRTIPAVAKPEAEDYTIWPYILPHYWLPNIGIYEDGALLGGSTAGSDPLGKHSYSLAAAFETEPEELSLQALYANNTTSASILTTAFDYMTSVPNTPIRFRQQHYGVDSLWEVTAISSDFFAGVGYSWIGRDYTNVNYSYAGTSFQNAETESHGPSLLATYSNLTMSGAQISPEKGLEFKLVATEYLRGGIMAEDFRQYQLSVQQYFSAWLPRHHAVLVRAQGQYIDRNVSLANQAFTVSNTPFANALSPFYIMRGYEPAKFLGKSLGNYSLEYRFPLLSTYRGAGMAPLFIKRLHAALVADGLTVDGYAYNRELDLYQRVNAWKFFWNTGAELKFDLTLGYHFPLTVVLGSYFPQVSHSQDSQQFAITIQL